MGPWTWALLLANWMAGNPPGRNGCAGPVDPPEGWLRIPREVVDSFPGAYHDAVSGTYVAFDTYRRGPDAMGRPGYQGLLQGVPYYIEITPNAREHEAEHWRRELGADYPKD